MTKEEAEKLLRLLRSFYPNDKALRDDDAAAAWYIALKPFSYARIKDVVVKWVREGKNFPPHVNEVAAVLVGEEGAPSGAPAPRDTVPDDVVIQNVTAYAVITKRAAPYFQSAVEAQMWFKAVRHEA